MACILLTIGVTSFSLGIPFVAAAVVAVALSPDRWRRVYCRRGADRRLRALVAGLGPRGGERDQRVRHRDVAMYLLKGFASSLASMAGLATPGTRPG